jgi:hypothetical protein
MRLIGAIHISSRIYKGFLSKNSDDVVYGIVTFLNANDIVEVASHPIHFQISTHSFSSPCTMIC